jgi:hypothetical protein
VFRPDIVSAPAEQEIEGLAMRRKYRLSRGGIAIRRCPSAVWVVAIFVRAAGSLDHSVERNMFDDFELSHLQSPYAGPGHGVNPAALNGRAMMQP